MLAPGEHRIDLTEDRRGRKIAYPPVGFTSTYDPKRELPRPDVNLPLLTKLAQISGGEINPRSIETQEKQISIRTEQPLRNTIIVILLALFLIEIAIRKLVIGEELRNPRMRP